MRDYNIDYRLRDPKNYYKDLNAWLKIYPDINELYYHAVTADRLDLVKIALNRGADINYQGISGVESLPIVKAMEFTDLKMLDYLLGRGAINSKQTSISTIKSMVDLVENTPGKPNKARLVKIFYDKMLPKTYKYLAENQRYWRTAADKLEEFNADPESGLQDLYNKRIEELRDLARG